MEIKKKIVVLVAVETSAFYPKVQENSEKICIITILRLI